MKLAFETDNGIGTRANFGAIVLETDETIEPEFSKMIRGDGIALYHSRIPMVSEVNSETLAQMAADLPAAAALLPRSMDFDVIGYGCTSASTVIGSKKVAQAIQSVFPNAKVTNPLDAIIAACTSLSVKKLGFVTPYVAEVSAAMRRKLEDNGFSIEAFGSFEEGDDRVVARVTPNSIKDAAKRVAKSADCEAIFIACTNLRCLGVIPELEDEIGIPVLSSNQALGWHMLRLAGVNDPAPEFGRLFA